ncbi:protoporphyrinogen oxidase [Herpetosiphon sp. NSE202]|uniref:protoporphyrinogen oxidase n=1 Tax=Herpetosiphon sp. NSE202 TaxID=3351349 RepID=UPI0036437DC6
MDVADQPRIAIIGGGIAGLSTAWYLQKQGLTKIQLFERDQRLGGKLLTKHVALPDAAGELLVEAGPDAFISQKPWGLQLARELGLDDQLISTEPARHKVFVLHRGQPEPLPDGINLVVPTEFWPLLRTPILSWPGKLRMLLDLVLPARQSNADESLADFVRRRFGAEALDKLGEPLMSGIHNAESDRQSLEATFPRFIEAERSHGSVIRGIRAAKVKAGKPKGQQLSPFISLRGGIEQLITTLVDQLTVELRTNCGVQELRYDPTNAPAYQLTLDDGSRVDADVVVLAVPSYAAATLVQPWAEALAERLQAIRYVSTGTVSLAFRRSESTMAFDSYGLVIPRSEHRLINAVTINSRKFAGRAPADYMLLRAFVGGSKHPEVLRLDDQRLTELVRDQLKAIFGLDAEPVWSGVARWNEANPQYDVGHFQRMDQLEALCPEGLLLCGSGFRGVGIPDCVRQAQTTAATIVDLFAQTNA